MGYAVIRYSVKKESVEENRKLVADVFEELDRSRPSGLRYLVLELDNGEFIHFVEENGPSPLPGIAAFKMFTENHAERRSAPIVRTSAAIVGNYRMLTAEGQAQPPAAE